jgi:seryl-tRNA synthetase
MHDIKFIRTNPDAFDAALKRRGLPAESQKILAADKEVRGGKNAMQDLQTRANQLAKQIGETKSKGGNADALLAESKELKAKIAELKAQQESGVEADAGASAADELLMRIPNILADDVPEGVGEQDNKEVKKHGTPLKFSFTPKDHVALGEALGMMDFEQAAKISGARFVVLKGALARLERALAAFMLDIHTKEFAYTEVSPPLIVRDTSLRGTGQLPKFEEDMFKTTEGRYLISTSEISLTNLVQDSIVESAKLPLRFTAHTPCFRSEAGSAGKDTRGMIRMHQFTKVELVSITKPEDSEKEHERMTACAEEVLKRLGLAYRVMLLCSKDTGFSARKTYDLEVWLPAQDTFREISSCSNCGDFQARRMKARFRDNPDAPTQFVHTLNGSGLAVGRTLIAIMENYQQEDGSIGIPEALQPYMGGVKVIRK